MHHPVGTVGMQNVNCVFTLALVYNNGDLFVLNWEKIIFRVSIMVSEVRVRVSCCCWLPMGQCIN